MEKLEEKKNLRKKMKALRDRLSYEEVLDLSQKLTERVVSHYEFIRAKDILIYMHYQNEVRTDGIIGYAWMLRKRVFVPRVNGNEMEFYEIRDLKECAPGYQGINEPVLCTSPYEFKEGLKEEPLMILPGLAFDEKGGRLGYGGGFYDRFLESRPACTKMGIGFDFQCVGEVPAGGQDIPMDLVVTEERTEIIFTG